MELHSGISRSKISEVHLTESTTSEAIETCDDETPNTNRVTISAPSFVRLFVINRIINHEFIKSITNNQQKTTMIKQLMNKLPENNLIRTIAFDIAIRLMKTSTLCYLSGVQILMAYVTML